jgi:hypothetical protein
MRKCFRGGQELICTAGRVRDDAFGLLRIVDLNYYYDLDYSLYTDEEIS